MSKLEPPSYLEMRRLATEINQLQYQRRTLRDEIRRTRHGWRKYVWYFHRKHWQTEYENLGLVWHLKRTKLKKFAGLDLTGATLLNDEGEKIDSEEFKRIAVNKIQGKADAGEVYLRAKYDYADGRVVPASEVYQMTEKETEPFKIYRNKVSDK